MRVLWHGTRSHPDSQTQAPVSEWQTTWTQNPRAERRGGSTPSRGTIHSGRYLSPGVGTADDLDLKSKGRKAWGSESPSGHHVGERPEKGRVQKKKSCEHNGSKEQLGASCRVRLVAASAVSATFLQQMRLVKTGRRRLGVPSGPSAAVCRHVRLRKTFRTALVLAVEKASRVCEQV